VRALGNRIGGYFSRIFWLFTRCRAGRFAVSQKAHSVAAMMSDAHDR
jgi:hypothetical protein